MRISLVPFQMGPVAHSSLWSYMYLIRRDTQPLTLDVNNWNNPLPEVNRFLTRFDLEAIDWIWLGDHILLVQLRTADQSKFPFRAGVHIPPDEVVWHTRFEFTDPTWWAPQFGTHGVVVDHEDVRWDVIEDAIRAKRENDRKESETLVNQIHNLSLT